MQAIATRLPLETELARPARSRGEPSHIPPAIVDVDRRIGQAMKCSRCHKRGMAFHPLHKANVYRVVLICSCGHREEM